MSHVEIPSPTPRRVSLPRWLDLRLVLGVALVLVAVVIGATVISRARHTDKHLAVTRDLAAGATLRAADLRVVDTQLPSDGQVYLRDADKAIGRVLARPLGKGELVPRGALATAPARTTVSVPFAAGAAPSLERGQRIVVWLSTKTCPSAVLLPDVTVQDVRSGDAGALAPGGGQDVVLSVPQELAQRVVGALALDGATIRAGVLTGTRAAAPTTLPGLDSCGTPTSP
jgi:hypothetical protein